MLCHNLHFCYTISLHGLFFRCPQRSEFRSQECSVCPQSLQHLTNCSTCPFGKCLSCSRQKFRGEILSESKQEHLKPFMNKTEKYFSLTVEKDESGITWYRTVTKFVSAYGSKIWQKVDLETELSLSEDFIEHDDEDGSTTESNNAAPTIEYDPPDIKNLRHGIKGDEISKRLQSDVSNAENKHDSKGMEEAKTSEYNPLTAFLQRKSVANSTFQNSSLAENVLDFIKGK